MTWLAYSHLGVAKTVQLTTQPAVALAGIAFGVQPVGRLVDGSGVLSRATGVTVTASKASGTGTLSGTLSVQTVEGVFTFTDLKMDTVTSAVTLQFASSGLTSAVSNAFNVTQPNITIGIESGTYAITGTAQTLTRGPYMMRQDTVGSYAITGTAATLSHGGTVPTVNAYFNSTEAGGDGSDPAVLLADDFSRGWWYRKDADHNGAGSGFASNQQGTEAGWSGTIYYGVDASGNVGDGGAIAADNAIFSNYAAFMGTHTGGAGGTYMAEHNLAGGGAEEIWLRYYKKWSSGYTFGAEKTIVSFNKQNGGGIYFGNVHINLGGNASSNGTLYFQPTGGGNSNQNTGFVMTGNLHWYCIIVHIKLGSGNLTNDGILQIWADDCGLDGVSGPGSPTLRLSNTSYAWPKASGDKIGSLWFESWANPGSTGQSWFKNVMVRTDHSPGFRTA